ncbi:MAG TPA: hypothetical protein VFX86_04920 [Candidatus Saccharimonadales bacterium]|nr:hypothetical protein [Candidatus Saccharimonadales bacterium]
MATNSHEDGPEKRGHILFRIDDEASVASFISGVASLAEASGVELEFVDETQISQNLGVASVQERSSITKPKLFTWAMDPDTGNYVSIITRDDAVSFTGGGGDTPRARKNRASHFFNGIKGPHISNLARDDGGYALLAQREESGRSVVGIRVIRALELLRKLKNEELGESKSDGTVGIKDISARGITFFEEYCRALFPRVDIDMATKPLPLKRFKRRMEAGHKQAHGWLWVTEQEKGTLFRNRDVEMASGYYGGGQRTMDILEKVGLISRIPPHPFEPHDSNPSTYPFTRLWDDRWEDLYEFLTDEGVSSLKGS